MKKKLRKCYKEKEREKKKMWEAGTYFSFCTILILVNNAALFVGHFMEYLLKSLRLKKKKEGRGFFLGREES